MVAGAAIQVSDLKERQASVWDNIKAMDEPPNAMVKNSMERLTGLLEKAEPILQAVLPTDIPEPFQSPQPVISEGGQPDTLTSKRNK
jgi:hypothetical protein